MGNTLQNAVYFVTMDSPIGRIRLRATDQGLLALDHVNQQSEHLEHWKEERTHRVLKQAQQELEQYFTHQRQTFTVPLAPCGTDFQKQVWCALQDIPYAQTRSYSEIAEKMGNPTAVRAVGAANGRNPLSIFIPCHRVIGKNGKLTGYAGGLEVKRILLSHERGDFRGNFETRTGANEREY